MPIPASLVAHPNPIPPVAPVTIATCMSSIHRCQGCLDLVFEHFAGVVSRQSLPDDHLLGRFEDSDSVGLQKDAEAVDVGVLLIVGHDDSAGSLAGARVGQTDDGDLGDAGMAD